MDSGNTQQNPALARKAFEISYALVRLSAEISRDAFSHYFKDLGLKTLEAVTLGRNKEALSVLKAIEYFARLAGSTGAISSRNSEVIAEEAEHLHSAISGIEDGQRKADLDLSSVFSNEPIIIHPEKPVVKVPEAKPAPVQVPEKQRIPVPEVHATEAVPAEEVDSEFAELIEQPSSNHRGFTMTSEMRQSAILDKIRQSENCRMKDVQELFPKVSERTLRNDLQALVEHGVVERVGQSGPATFYRARAVILA